MYKFALLVLFLCSLVFVPSPQAQPQDDNDPNAYYVFDGKALAIAKDNPAYAGHTRLQAWLYPAGVRIPRHTAGLQYSRCVLIEDASAGRVLKRLEAAQRIEGVYLNLFEPHTWRHFTFLNALSP